MKRWGLALSLALAAAAGAPAAPPASPAAGDEIRLVVVVTVDQMRADYLTRFADQFRDGFKSLLAQGRVFTGAHQEHACTFTAGGHTAIFTGVHPARSGMIGDEWYDRRIGMTVHSDDDPAALARGILKPSASAAASRSSTLGDWLRESSPASKVVAISGKSRAAVAMAGRKATGVFWFDDKTGEFTSSSAFSAELPPWVKQFNQGRPAARYAGSVWEPGVAGGSSQERTGTGPPGECTRPAGGLLPVPPAGSEPDRSFYSALAKTPFVDELTLELAKAAIRSERLGQRDAVDLLAVSFSALDPVGHSFGPDSDEVRDVVLRLDADLGHLLRLLDREIGRKHLLIVLTSDHGVQDMPETDPTPGAAARRLPGNYVSRLAKGLEFRLVRAIGPGPWVDRTRDSSIYLNAAMPAVRGRSRSEVERRAAEMLKGDPAIADVFTRTELLAGQTQRSPYGRLYRNCFDPERSGDLIVQLREGYLMSSKGCGSNHGSPYEYDTHVPLVFAGWRIAPGRSGAAVGAVDIAPTLADVLGLKPPQELDGRSLDLGVAREGRDRSAAPAAPGGRTARSPSAR